MKKKKKYNKPILKSVKLKDIDFKAAMIVYWRNLDQWTSGPACS